MDYRIGHGYDVHKFGGAPPLRLGGVVVDEKIGVHAHSDGDVLLHAILDAFLGALALGDIGQWFPDSSSEYKDVSSVYLAETVRSAPQTQGWRISNMDATLVTQTPKIEPFALPIIASLADIFDVARDRVSVKGTTTEHMGFTGRKEGIAAYCVLLLQQEPG